MKITGEVTGIREINVRILGMTDRIREELRAEMLRLTPEIQRHIQQDKLSGQSLNAVTGRLRASIGSRVYDVGNAIVGEVYSSGVPYARIQNDGGRTPPHTILPRTAKALHFFGARDGAELFLARVNHPGSRYPGVHFMGQGLYDMRERVINDLFEAVKRGVRK